MKCPTCVEEGERSIVSPQGQLTTLMGVSQWYDEDGDWHYHDPNGTAHNYICSRGHKWGETTYKKCPSCDYGRAPRGIENEREK